MGVGIFETLLISQLIDKADESIFGIEAKLISILSELSNNISSLISSQIELPSLLVMLIKELLGFSNGSRFGLGVWHILFSGFSHIWAFKNGMLFILTVLVVTFMCELAIWSSTFSK